jgi:Flp pilus assembly pilin Flp
MNSTICADETLSTEISDAVATVTRCTRLRRRAEQGATAVEYALMVGLIAVGIITAVASLRDKTSNTFNTVNSAMGDSPSAPAGTLNYTSISGSFLLPGGQRLWYWVGASQPLPPAAIAATTAAEANAAFTAAGWSYADGPMSGTCTPGLLTCYRMP